MDEHQDDELMHGGETGSSGGPDAGQPGAGQRGPSPNQMLNQLQAMIDNIAQQAAPVVRDVAAKAAELAAVAAERAGPIAHRAADVTQEVGVKVAARSKEVAADLRRGSARGPEQESTATSESSGGEDLGGYGDGGDTGSSGGAR